MNGYEMPNCSGYEGLAEIVGADDAESMIAYPVEVGLFPRQIVEPVAGPIMCWPAQ